MSVFEKPETVVSAVLTYREKLYPRGGKPNAEQLEIWRRVLAGITIGDALETMRCVAERSKWAPTPSEFRDEHRRRCPQVNTTGATPTRPNLSHAELLRASWARGDARWANLPDVDLIRAFHEWEFQRALSTYGPAARSTVAFWAKWRSALENASGEGFGTWTPEAEASLKAAIDAGHVVLPEHCRPRKPAPVEAAA